MKILIVEDEKGLRESIEDYFGEDGNICEVAGNYNDAIAKVSIYHYDCILLDISLRTAVGLMCLSI